MSNKLMLGLWRYIIKVPPSLWQKQIAKGKKLTQILEEMDQVAEGILTTKSVYKLANKFNAEMPITREIYNVLFEDKDPMKAVNELMVRDPKSEIEYLP